MRSIRNPGRSAGLLYLLVSIPGAFAMIYIPGRLIVDGNATATADAIAASEMLFLLGIAVQLISQALFIFVALALFHLLKGVNQRHAMAMLVLIVVSMSWAATMRSDAFLRASSWSFGRVSTCSSSCIWNGDSSR